MPISALFVFLLFGFLGSITARRKRQDSLSEVLAQASAEDGSEASGTDGGTIVEVMEDMLEKSEAQQADGQKAEMEAAHAYSLLKLSLEDMMKAANKELAASKKQKAIASEKQSTAEGDVEWLVNSNAGTGEKEISKSQIPNFPGLVLFCIDISDSESRRIFQHFHQSTRSAFFCSAPNSKN